VDERGHTFADIHERISLLPTVEDAIDAFRSHYGVAHTTYHLAQTVMDRLDSPFVRTTYPSAWVSRYLQRNYVKLDPVILEGTIRSLPFDWSELELKPEAVPLFLDARCHGLGASGYSIPVVDKRNRRALFSINSDLTGESWRLLIRSHAVDWAELAYVIHKIAMRELYGLEPDHLPLSPRELECLTWTARGKDHKEIAIILGLSNHTVLGYLKSTRFKLDCVNLSQATSKAIILRLIAP